MEWQNIKGRRPMPNPNTVRAALLDRLLIGCYPTGLVYADKSREEHGDYVRVAYLNYGTLELTIDSPKSDLLPLVRESAASMQAMRGQRFPIAGNMNVVLGSAYDPDKDQRFA